MGYGMKNCVMWSNLVKIRSMSKILILEVNEVQLIYVSSEIHLPCFGYSLTGADLLADLMTVHLRCQHTP